MIIITGALGFIGSCLIQFLNDKGINNIAIVDDFSFISKVKNIENKIYSEKIEREVFINWLKSCSEKIEILFHIGARTDTTEKDYSIFEILNLNFSKELWNVCSQKSIPLIYASSAATYGLGEFGYTEDYDLIPKLKPLNPYAVSKNEFDKWVLKQKTSPPNWYGLKFFNVYGPNEYHKSRMASVVYQAFNQIRTYGKMRLFKSHVNNVKDGEQKRDFIYVLDVCKVCYFLYQNKPENGIYNLGSGIARSFFDLTLCTFKAMNLKLELEFIDTPNDIRNSYQYFTEANMEKLISSGYKDGFTTIEDGISDYVQNFLSSNNYY